MLHNTEIVSRIASWQILSELPKTHFCCECGQTIDLRDYRVKFGRRFCSILCEDISEERNQGYQSKNIIYE